jgi:hypothetical protein
LLVKDVRRETLEDARFALLASRERNKPIVWVPKLPNEAKSSSIYNAIIFLASLPWKGRPKGRSAEIAKTNPFEKMPDTRPPVAKVHRNYQTKPNHRGLSKSFFFQLILPGSDQRESTARIPHAQRPRGHGMPLTNSE